MATLTINSFLLQIVLRDFKSSNILLDDQWNAKLSDFGLAQCQPQVEESTSFFSQDGGMLLYMYKHFVFVIELLNLSDVITSGCRNLGIQSSRVRNRREAHTQE